MHSLEYIKDNIAPITERDEINIDWLDSSGTILEEVCIFIRESFIARLKPGQDPGWSANVREDSPLAKVEHEKADLIWTDLNFQEIPNAFDVIDPHLDEYFKQDEILVLHEKKSDLIHSDVYFIKPSTDRPYYILLTSGMSSLPMNVPEGYEYLQYAEVMMLLPPHWNMNYEDFKDENTYWPIRILKEISKYPHKYNTWFGLGHSIELDDSLVTDHNFKGVVLLESIKLSEEFTIVETKDKLILIYSVIPLFKEEMDFLEKEGYQKLLQKFTPAH